MAIIWCITGAGHLLRESLDAMKKSSDEVTVVFSAAGHEVAMMYHLFDEVKAVAKNMVFEDGQGESSPFCGKMYEKKYTKVIIAPATANTVAKLASGIADSLVTNVAAQALKRRVPVIVVPTDFEGKETSMTPDGRRVEVYPRQVDLDNLEKLKREGVVVVNNPKNLP
ncbi:MAG: hypothetical protein MSIBF_05715 [Candidatus Altiarchaeales archaeon IMC4]|nr:MAG: hypothetical protein MSIBF_05715 [Candidatus Altiarchaeales archaeon IMC4]